MIQIEKFLFFFLLLFYFFAQLSYSQTNSISPYSIFGYGERQSQSNAVYSAMGGAGQSFSGSNHINTENPASYSQLRYTTFLIEGTLKAIEFRTNELTSNQSIAYVSNFAIGLPFKKATLALGFKPFSSVGYSTMETNDEGALAQNIFFDGQGGINQVYLGGSYNIAKGLNIGLNINYLFGRIERRITSDQMGSTQFGTVQEENTGINGDFQFDLGVYYSKKIKNRTKINGGITYRPRTTVNTINEQYAYSVLRENIDMQAVPIDTVLSDISKGRLIIPSKLSIGAGLEKALNWGIGAQVDLEQFSEFETSGVNQRLDNSLRFATGGYWIPKYNSFQSFFERVTYRAGLYYEQTHITIDSNRLNDYGITFGLGLPISNDGTSSLNIAIQGGKRGTRRDLLIEENYINLRLNFTFNNLWFKKRKYD